MQTALFSQFAAHPSRLGEYRGAATALEFSGTGAEFSALVRGCGVSELGWRGKFRIFGPDCGRWLNGMVTNNVRDLAEGHGVYNFVLNAQGRIQGDCFVYHCGDHFLADADRTQLPALLTLLERYIIMDEVELADASAEFAAFGVRGPRARQALTAAGLGASLPGPLELRRVALAGVELLCAAVASEPSEAYEIWTAPATAPGVWSALVEAGAVPAGAEALEMLRVAAGIPCYGIDIRDRDLPQETGQSQALNFAKGCYLGQEIVERIRSRGAVHRSFTGFTVAGPAPTAGAKLYDGDKEAGEITSICDVPLPGAASKTQTLALGYVRREFAQPGCVLSAGEARLTVSQIPFPQIFSSELTNGK
jgi:aminomethyltransferase